MCYLKHYISTSSFLMLLLYIQGPKCKEGTRDLSPSKLISDSFLRTWEMPTVSLPYYITELSRHASHAFILHIHI